MIINGRVTNNVDAADRGLAYGDGLFSTIKVESGVMQDWPLHLQRFKTGAERLFFPVIDWGLLEKEAVELAQQCEHQAQVVLKIIITRGSGGRGYSCDGCDQPVRILSLSVFPDSYLKWQKEGIKLAQCQTLLSRNKQLAGLKSLARLEQVLIKQELKQLQADEGIVCDEFGHVIEGCSANLFLYLDGQWVTPKLNFSGVAGVMRARIMQHPNIQVIEKEVTLADVNHATCLCLTNALMGIVPVKQYQGIQYSPQQRQQVALLQAMLIKETFNND